MILPALPSLGAGLWGALPGPKLGVGGARGVERLGGGLGRLGSRSIGLDIDRSALKAVQAARSVGAYTLRHVGYHSLPPAR